MLQFDGGQAATTAAYPSTPPPAGAGACALGPTYQGTGVVINVFNALVDLKLLYRNPAAPGGDIRETEIIGFPPIAQVFPGAIGFACKQHNLGETAEVIGVVWETIDGPLPQAPYLQTATLTPGGQVTPTVGSLLSAVRWPISPLPQSIADSTVLAVTTGVTADFNNDTATFPGPVPPFVPVGPTGIYDIGLLVGWAANPAGWRGIGVRDDLGSQLLGITDNAVNGTFTTQSLRGPVSLAAGRNLEIYVEQTSGGPLNVVSGWLSITRIG